MPRRAAKEALNAAEAPVKKLSPTPPKGCQYQNQAQNDSVADEFP